MAHSLTSGMLTATEADVCAPVLFIEVDSPGGDVFFWTGYGNILWNGITWIGQGDAIGIGAITEQNAVMATGCSLSLSGVNIALVAVVLEDLQRYQPAKVWLGAIDSNYAVIADPYLILNGRVDAASIIATGKTATITVTAESRLIGMRFPKWRRYTQLDQQIEHPQDAGFTFVDTLQDASIAFGVSGGPGI